MKTCESSLKAHYLEHSSQQTMLALIGNRKCLSADNIYLSYRSSQTVENIYLWIIYLNSDGKALFQLFFSYYPNSSSAIQCEFLPFHDLLLFTCAERQCSTDTGKTELSTKDFVSANPLIKNAVTSRKCEVLLYFILSPFSSSGTMHFYREAMLKLVLVTMFLITWQCLHLFQLLKNSPKHKC